MFTCSNQIVSACKMTYIGFISLKNNPSEGAGCENGIYRFDR
jgi:hypothetical protein